MAKTFKRTLAIATLATSMVLMGGAASALSIPPLVGTPENDTTRLIPSPISKATQAVRNAEADADGQVRKLQKAF